MSAFVKSVEYVEITLTGSTAVQVDLTKSQTIADCVPFFTVNLTSDVDDFNNRRYAEVYFEAGPKVTARRDHATGTCIVGVFVVEFDTSGDISVEQGTWVQTGVKDITETISSVTTAKAFVVINYRHSLAGDDWNEAQVRVFFNSGTELAFQRANSAGNNTGRYYVVSTTGTDFAVDHQAISVLSGDETTEVTISATVVAKTFIVTSYEVNEGNDDIEDGGIVADLKDTTTIRARRNFDSFGGSPGISGAVGTVNVQVVEAQGTEFSVERAECDWGDSLTEAVTITEIDQTKAIVVAGGYQGVMSALELDGPEVDGNYAILKFTSDTVMTGTRATNTAPDGTTFFEVVEFELVAAGGDVTMVAAQGSYALTGQAATTTKDTPVVAAQGSYALTGKDAILSQTKSILAAQGAYALTGKDANTFWGHAFAAAQGSYVLTGQAAITVKDTPITAVQGAYALTGQAAITSRTKSIPADQGAYTLTGKDAATRVGQILAAVQGAYALTGQPADLLWDHLIAAVQGSYALTGQAAVTTKDTPVVAAQGSYSLTGQAANLLWGHAFSAVQGSYALTGQAALTFTNPVMAADQGSYALTGQATNLLENRLVTAVQGSYALNGQDAILLEGILLAAAQGSYVLTGQTANTLWAHKVLAEQGSYVLTGQPATLIFVGSAGTRTMLPLLGVG